MAVTSSLNSIHISPRTPRTPRSNMAIGEEEDAELELLNEEERIQLARHFHDSEDDASILETEDASKRPISPKDKRNMVLLCVLCGSAHLVSNSFAYAQFHQDLLQGIPVRGSLVIVRPSY